MNRTGTDLDVSDPLDPLAPYTSHRLLHASPEHLYLTSRRAFIGPIPEGWLKSHRKDSYKHHFHLNYSSKAATFRAQQGTGTHRHTTGLDHDTEGVNGGRRNSSRKGSLRAGTFSEGRELLYQASFRQPTDVDEDDIVDSDSQRQETSGTLALNESKAIRSGDNIAKAGGTTGEHDESTEGSIIDDSLPLDGSGRHAKDATEIEGRGEAERPAELGGPGGEATKAPPVTPESKFKAREIASRRDGSKSPPGAKVTKGTSPLKPESLRRIITENTNPDSLPVSSISSRNQAQFGEQDHPGTDASTSSLLEREAKPEEGDTGSAPRTNQTPTRGILAKVKTRASRSGEEVIGDLLPARRKSNIRFEFPEDLSQAAVMAKARIAQMDIKRPLMSALGRRTGMDGQIIKMEKMLVRVDVTQEKKLPADYDENGSQGIITTTIEKWREFMVVCRQGREGSEEDFVLQIYKTRVIPAIEKSGSGHKFTRELPLDRKHTKVNLYSSLDKSVVVWVPDKTGTKIIILRPATTHSGVEWFTFLRNILGWHRATQITVHVPDMNVSLKIDDPFHIAGATDTEDEDEIRAVEKAAAREQIVAKQIVDRCIQELKGSTQWADVVDAWIQHQRVGLAWKRYDRLEWIYGVNEKKMYGTIALMKYMDLELRAKEHYPTETKSKKGNDMTEPPAIEGFLVRLTNQKGAHQRMGKLFFKRLYYHTHDQYLFYSRPAKADPPSPPTDTAPGSADNSNSHDLPAQIPLIYAINPYPVQAGEIAWLREGYDETAAHRRQHDQDASDEYRRKVQNVSDCDGFINLCDVKSVRNVMRGSVDADEHLGSGSDVDFDMDVADASDDDGTTTELDDARTFELSLLNGLVVRLQAYDKQTKKEWKKRLEALVKYWKRRHLADIDLIKSVRSQNLRELDIDEETEAIMGQFAKKWEVTKSFASPVLYNMCGISCCRTVHNSGPLFFKPRLHKLFTSVQCVLIPGRLLLFETVARSRSGRAVPHIHQQKLEVIDLKECYLYSGLLTENDLLYQNQTFDSNSPGHHALPRMWIDEGWTSRDEDVMCCFVLWRPLGRGWFKSPQDVLSGETSSDDDNRPAKGTRLKRVTKLGATGRSSVFRARTRVERDHWVLALAAEIERVKGYEDVRITEGQSRREA